MTFNVKTIVVVLAVFGVGESRAQMSVRSSLMMPTTGEERIVRSDLFQTRMYSERKSVTQAVLYSILLPGAGEYYAENYSSAKTSLIADGGLWLLYLGFQYHGAWVRNDARAFAAQHANIDVSGQEDQFEVDLGNFLTTDDFNRQRQRDRDFDRMYTAVNQQWAWDSDASRASFREMRIRSDEIHNYGKFVIAGLIVNRIVSAFGAARAVNAFNRTLRADRDWQLEAKPVAGLLGTDGLELRLTKQF